MRRFHARTTYPPGRRMRAKLGARGPGRTSGTPGRGDRVDARALERRRLGAARDAHEPGVSGERALGGLAHRRVGLDADDPRARLEEHPGENPRARADVGHDAAGPEAADAHEELAELGGISRPIADVVVDAVGEALLGIEGSGHGRTMGGVARVAPRASQSRLIDVGGGALHGRLLQCRTSSPCPSRAKSPRRSICVVFAQVRRCRTDGGSAITRPGSPRRRSSRSRRRRRGASAESSSRRGSTSSHRSSSSTSAPRPGARTPTRTPNRSSERGRAVSG